MGSLRHFAVLCVTLTTFIEWTETVPPETCLNAHAECLMEERCRMTWEFFNGTCRGQECRSTHTSALFCNAGYNTLINNEYDFSNCRCDIFLPRFDDCLDIQETVLRNPCRTIGTSAETPEAPVQPRTCLEAEQTCLSDSTCSNLLTSFTEKCGGLSDNVCSSIEGNCAELKREVDETFLKDCVCPANDDDDVTCEHIWEIIHRNPCAGSCQTVLQHEELAGGRIDGGSTCQSAVDQCSSNTTCHDYFSSYLSACMVDMATGTCRHEECMRAMRDVFTTVSPSLTHDMFFCHCKDGDSACHRMKSVMSPQCIEGDTPSMSCLLVKATCEADTCCKSSYDQMVDRCSFEKNDCLRDYAECRTALVGTFGTVLTKRCICEEGDQLKQEMCLEYFQMMLQNPCVEKSSKAYLTDSTDRISSGCPVPTPDLAGRHSILMPEGVYVKFSSHNESVQKACLCAEGGVLVDCIILPVNRVESCDGSVESDTVTSVTKSSVSRVGERYVCACIDGNVVCINERIDNITNTPTHEYPSLKVAFSKREMTLANSVMNNIITTQSIARRLEDISTNMLNWPTCPLTAYEENMDIMVFSITDNCTECLEQLADLINTRHPFITHDLLLSVLKLSVVTKEPTEYSLPLAVGSKSTTSPFTSLLLVALIFTIQI